MQVPTEVMTYLTNHHVAVLAMNQNGHPHQSVMYYTQPAADKLQMITKLESQKVQLLNNKPEACAVVYDEAQLKTLSLTGHIEIASDQNQVMEAYSNLSKRIEAIIPNHVLPVLLTPGKEMVVLNFHIENWNLSEYNPYQPKME